MDHQLPPVRTPYIITKDKPVTVELEFAKKGEVVPTQLQIVKPKLHGIPPQHMKNVTKMVVYLPAKIFTGAAEGLADYRTNTLTPKKCVHFMYTLAHLVQNPALGRRTSSAAQIRMRRGKGRDDEAEEGENIDRDDTEGPEENVDNNSELFMMSMLDPEHPTPVQRTEIYMEVVMSADSPSKEAKAAKRPPHSTSTSEESRSEDDEVSRHSSTTPSEDRLAEEEEERRRKDNRIVGYRYWFFFQDESFDPNVAIQNLISLNKEEKAKTKDKKIQVPKAEWEVWHDILSTNQWIDYFLTPVLGAGTFKDDTARTLPLSDRFNPANMTKCFSLNRALAEPNACPRQRSRCYYYNDKVGWMFPEPKRVYRIPVTQFTPALLYVCYFPHIRPPQMDLPNSMTSPEKTLELTLRQESAVTAARRQLHAPSTGDDDFMAMAVRVARDLEKEYHLRGLTTPYERAAFRRELFSTNKKYLDDFTFCWTVEGKASPRIKAVVQWGINIQDHMQDKGLQFSLVQYEPAFDSCLSPFANFLINRLNALEHIFDMVFLHKVVLVSWFAGLGATHSDLDMKTNVVLTGGAQVGKSFVGDMLEQHIFIDGTIMRITHITTQALNSETSFMNYIFYYDEIPNAKLGLDENGKKNGTGVPADKAMLTDQKVTSVVFTRTDDGKRVSLVTTTKQSTVMTGNTNYGKHKIPDAMVTRLLPIEIPDFDRPGHSVAELGFSSAVLGKERNEDVKRQDFIFQKVHYLYTMAVKMIEVGLITPPTLTIAYTVFIRMKKWVAEKGFNTRSTRSFKRLMNHARTLTLLNALYTVFFTPIVFPEGKTFHPQDMFAIEPYLMCTEEIAVYIFTSLLCMYVDPNEAVVMKALVARECHYTDAGGVGNNVNFKIDSKQNTDYNYLKISTDTRYPKLNELISMVATKAKESLIGNRVSLDTEGIEAILYELQTRTFETETYEDDINELSGPMLKKPIVEVNLAIGCLYVLRQYIDATFKPEFDDIGMHAISAIHHKHTTPRPIITGIGYEKKPISGIVAPHILRTHNLVPNKKVEMTMINLNLPRIDFDATDVDENVDNYISEARATYDLYTLPKKAFVYVVEDDLTKIEFKRRLNHCGYPFTNDANMNKDSVMRALPHNYEALYFASKETNRGVYPNHLITRFVETEQMYEMDTAALRENKPESLRCFGEDSLALPNRLVRELKITDQYNELQKFRQLYMNNKLNHTSAGNAPSDEAVIIRTVLDDGKVERKRRRREDGVVPSATVPVSSSDSVKRRKKSILASPHLVSSFDDDTRHSHRSVSSFSDDRDDEESPPPARMRPKERTGGGDSSSSDRSASDEEENIRRFMREKGIEI